MKELQWRVRIATLWLIDAIAVSAAFALAFLEPGYLSEILSGMMEGMEINAGVLILAAVFWLIPLIMAYLSIVLKPPGIKWIIIVFGLILGLLNLFDFFGQLTSSEAIGIARALMIALMAIVPFLIAWHGWKWPQEG